MAKMQEEKNVFRHKDTKIRRNTKEFSHKYSEPQRKTKDVFVVGVMLSLSKPGYKEECFSPQRHQGSKKHKGILIERPQVPKEKQKTCL
jgi:hypothetical protein